VEASEVMRVLYPKRRRLYDTTGERIALIVIIVTVILTGTFAFWHFKLDDRSVVPNTIAEKVLFPTYSPNYLPSGYSIDKQSFSIQSGQVIVFQAVNKSGGNIAVSEEAVPSGFNFNAFYGENFNNIINLQQVPYTSVTGALKTNNRWIMSVDTGKTWLLFTSAQHFSLSTSRAIAVHIHSS
jgi:hypothetical protein